MKESSSRPDHPSRASTDRGQSKDAAASANDQLRQRIEKRFAPHQGDEIMTTIKDVCLKHLLARLEGRHDD